MFIGIYNSLTEEYVNNVVRQLAIDGITMDSYSDIENPYAVETSTLPVFFVIKSGKPGYYLHGIFPYDKVLGWAQSI